MDEQVERAGLRVDAALAAFLEGEVLGPLNRDSRAFWTGFAALCARFVPRSRALLARRDALQAQIDAWHTERAGQAHDPAAYRAFLESIGYLVPEPEPIRIATRNVDPEVAALAGPQLVVPGLDPRFVLNAANARWGSLYDAWYGSDALPAAPSAPSADYSPERGAAVIAAGRAFLDLALPLEGTASWTDWDGEAVPMLCEPMGFAGRRPGGLLFCHNGLHIELVIDREHPVGAGDPAGIADIVLESALTAIVDFEDSVVAVDAEDKLRAYRNWLGLMRGDLTARFVKDGTGHERTLAPDREWTGADRQACVLNGRSLLFVRIAGLLTANPAVRLAVGSEIPEGILDAVVTSAIGAHDLAGLGRFRNSACGSIYLVTPKLHGPDECRFVSDLFDAVEDLLELPRHTVKVGLMDEERRTSANLGACIQAVRDRVVFINTGSLGRIGDEIHTSMRAGAMVRKGEMKQAAWFDAYEKRSVAIGLAHGFAGQAQIGKGMWAVPDRMHAMLVEKIAHPCSGATTAWVPSPTAATLHALHYHQVDVFDRQREVEIEPMPALDVLLTPPLAEEIDWPADEVRAELDRNAQGLLGYLVRWIDQGVGCSKVPDVEGVGRMEDRATLRVFSQHIANWLLHGICTAEQVTESLQRMAQKVDAQNAGDPAYRPVGGNWERSLAYQAAFELVFKGVNQPNGYTEPLLYPWRTRAKNLAGSAT